VAEAIFAGEGGVIFGGDNVGVLGADVAECLTMLLLIEILQGIGAVHLKGVGGDRVVAELFEFESGVDISFRPEEVNHLAEEDNTRGLALSSGWDGGEERFHERVKQGRAGFAMDHEGGESFGGIEGKISAVTG
jgi:hypothetical protein